MSSVQISVHFYVLKAAVVTRQVCKFALHELWANRWMFPKEASVNKGCLAPKSSCVAAGSGWGFCRANAVHGALPPILGSCLWRRCLMIVWTTSRCCQGGQMMSLVAKDNPVLGLNFHDAPHRQRGGGVDVCGLLYPHTAWCLGWGTTPKT